MIIALQAIRLAFRNPGFAASASLGLGKTVSLLSRTYFRPVAPFSTQTTVSMAASSRSRRGVTAAQSSSTPQSETPPATPKRGRRGAAASDEGSGATVTIKSEPLPDGAASTPPASSSKDSKDVKPSAEEALSARKLSQYLAASTGAADGSGAGPFPGFDYPSHDDAWQVARLLAEWHGYKRDEKTGEVALPVHRKPQTADHWGGCGNVPNVLEALIRVVLSCNTSNRNSSAAHKSLVERFGRPSAADPEGCWRRILDAPHEDLVDSIRCGGLANNKGRTIRRILERVDEQYGGKLSLDHMHDPKFSEEDLMRELLAFPGVGPKVAKCVTMFCIGKQTFAVDTHVFRLSKMLGWVPDSAGREETCYHLEHRLPGELKYPLHVLLIKHGKMCRHCSARGFATVKGEETSASESERDEGEEPAEEEEEEEDEKQLKPEAKDDEAQNAATGKRKERPCPLRQHALIHRRTYSKKKRAAGTASAGGSTTKKAKKEEPVANDDAHGAQDAGAQEGESPSKGRASRKRTPAVKKEEDTKQETAAPTRSSPRKRARA